MRESALPTVVRPCPGSNVKAGGKACAIRFQCAGCGFYRPDPSYMPAIEQHVNDLRADLETAKAMDADAFVVRNLTDQITAFTTVASTMRDRLGSLPRANARRSRRPARSYGRSARPGITHCCR
ncbi:hypothetical protein ACFWOJ_38395 [Streptomyces sp. NPDC058439]|uniref:hypothetical protein n=1 Tax=Streptomyces sp. NPDC058439 TaxID=3346500 RepID=UPI003650B72A